jgi:hypothetical protein
LGVVFFRSISIRKYLARSMSCEKPQTIFLGTACLDDG